MGFFLLLFVVLIFSKLKFIIRGVMIFQVVSPIVVICARQDLSQNVSWTLTERDTSRRLNIHALYVGSVSGNYVLHMCQVTMCYTCSICGLSVR